MIDEGYVKFHANWQKGAPPLAIEELIDVRNRLFKLRLIGEYADIGIGYGNVSKKKGESVEFYVSGSATGNFAVATASHFCLVTHCDFERNTVDCIGPVTASSESLTHAMLYQCSAEIGAILHVHHRQFWESLLLTAPTTAAQVAYGTPAMADEMARLMRTTDLADRKILAMAGHEEGIIAFGANTAEAISILLSEFALWEKCWQNEGGGD